VGQGDAKLHFILRSDSAHRRISGISVIYGIQIAQVYMPELRAVFDRLGKGGAMIRVFRAFVAVLALGIALPVEAQIDHDSWYFTAQEIEIAYRYQEHFGERMPRPVRGRECALGAKEFTATRNGFEFLTPCRFITETVRHLKEMISAGAARYLFPLDADHAHLAVPLRLWESKYSNLPGEELLPALLREPELAALYHSAEHLTVLEAPNKKIDAGSKAWKEKRNIVGYYDGRPIKVLPPDPRGIGLGIPPPYYSVGAFSFLASPKGELNILLPGRVITFDITFDIDGGETQAVRLPVRVVDPR
jgi:hypothetical protein